MTERIREAFFEEVLRNVVTMLDRVDRRLMGKRPHSNDIAWAKTIVDDIRTEVRAALNIPA